MSDYGATMKLAKLTKRTSSNGNIYFIGYMGLVKLLLFRDEASDDQWGEAWSLLVQEHQPKRQQSQKSSSSAKPVAKSATERARDGSGENANAPGQASAGRPFDDEVPF